MRIIEPSVELFEKVATPEERRKLIELAGRVCYKSEDRITADSANRFINSLIKRGHTSVLEHGNIILAPSVAGFLWAKQAVDREIYDGYTPYLRFTRTPDTTHKMIVSGNVRAWLEFMRRRADAGDLIPDSYRRMMLDNDPIFSDVLSRIYTHDTPTESYELFDLSQESPEVRRIHQTHTIRFITDRGVSHEIVRHRTLSFSQESTRYCRYDGGIQIARNTEHLFGSKLDLWEWVMQCADKAYTGMLEKGITPQDARGVLPTDLKTEIVVTGHDNDWIRFLKLRMDPAAHPRMRRIATQAAELLKSADPEVFEGVSECG